VATSNINNELKALAPHCLLPQLTDSDLQRLIETEKDSKLDIYNSWSTAQGLVGLRKAS